MRLGFLGVILVVKVLKSYPFERVATVEEVEVEEEMVVAVVVEYVATARYQFDQHASIIEYGFTNDILEGSQAISQGLHEGKTKSASLVRRAGEWLTEMTTGCGSALPLEGIIVDMDVMPIQGRII